MSEKASSSDTRVQATNDDSIVSKRSSNRAGYFEDDFLRFFVDKPSKRSCLINKGYYIRSSAVRTALRRFIELPSKDGKQLISVGAGFDSSFFVFSKQGLLQSCNTVYYEVDYPGVVQRKSQMISKTPELLEHIVDNKHKGPEINSKYYKLFDGDLREPTQLHKKFLEYGIDIHKPTLIFAECVLTYISADDTDPLIKYFCDTFDICEFVTYEQSHPEDMFGKVMCNNLKTRSSPLLGIHVYPDTQSQINRYKSLGFTYSEVLDMNSYWINGIDSKEKERVDNLELFDEEEEFKIKCGHYFLATSFKDSTNSNYFDPIYRHLLPVFDYPSSPIISTSSSCKWNDVSNITSGKKTSSMRWGHSANYLPHNKHIVAFGGYGGSKSHARLNDILLINPHTLEMSEPFVSGVPPSPRMFHTSSLYKESLYIVGGRESPTKALNQVYQLNCKDQYTWKLVETHGTFTPRWRHSASVINNNIFVFGGRSHDTVFNDCYKLNLDTMEWSKIETSGNIPSPRYSHTSNVINSTQLLIFGGISDSSKLYNDVYIFDTITNVWSRIETKGVSISPRFSHTSTSVGESIYVIGGCSPASLNDIYILNTSNWTWSTYILPNTNAILTKHTTIDLDNKLYILGGGALCFSFGTFFNSLEVLSLDGSDFVITPVTSNINNNNNNNKSEETEEHKTTAVTKTNVKKPKKSKKVTEIARIENPTVEEFLNISQNLRKPVIITNSNMGQCTKLWTPEYLTSLLKGKEISVHASQHKNLDFLNKNYKFQNISFEELFSKLYDPSFTDKLYVRSSGSNVRKDVSDIWESYPELTQDFQVPEFCPMAQRSSSQYFSSVFRVSSRDTTMWTHYDVMDNILCEISGTKLVTLWEPSEVRHLYVNGSTSRILDIESPDYKTFPKFSKARSMQGLLKAGEILYIPAFTFHHVSMLDPCISINIFWKDLPNEYYEKKDLYGNKDLILGTKAVKETDSVIQTLQQLPEYYREFYVRRVLENIKTAFNL